MPFADAYQMSIVSINFSRFVLHFYGWIVIATSLTPWLDLQKVFKSLLRDCQTGLTFPLDAF